MRRFGCVALGEEILELGLGGGVRAFENHVHDFAFAIAPRRLVADEIAEHQRIILAPRALRIGRLIDAGGEVIGIDVGQAEEHRRPIGGQRSMTVLGRPWPPVVMPQASRRFSPAGRGRISRSTPRTRPPPRPKPAAGAVYAHRQIQMPVRIDKPPLAVDLLHVEKARGLGLGVLVSAEFAVTEIRAGAQRVGFIRQFLAELLGVFDLPRIVHVDPLAELIDDRSLFQEFRSFILFGQVDCAKLDRGLVDGILHRQADRLDGGQFAERSPDRHPE